MISRVLRPSLTRSERVLDLFAGCGGLALGFEASGFETFGFELNSDCCATYNTNLRGHCTKAFLDADTQFPEAEVVIGGPPCQPFSVGGHQRGLEDKRDGFPAFVAAVTQLNPKFWMFENVRGLLYKNKWYLDEIMQRLERLGYIVEVRLMNASHFLVPQNRERIIVVGHRGGYIFPECQSVPVTASEALGSLMFDEPQDGRYLTESMDRYVAKYEKASKCINPRDLAPDRPARTVTCRNLGGATGDMQRILLPTGRRRRLTVQEGARLQSFPEWFQFSGSEGSQFNQVGNAVAPMFSLALARSLVRYLDQVPVFDEKEIQRGWAPICDSIVLA
jgi:DNA (cytosine-5)-methyltransferase 1